MKDELINSPLTIAIGTLSASQRGAKNLTTLLLLAREGSRGMSSWETEEKEDQSAKRKY